MENLKVDNPKALKEKLEVLRQGYDPGRFLLPTNEDVNPSFPLSIVTYRAQTFLPITYVRSHCNAPRLRLRPPLREKFGNWTGANLSRVGIEEATQIPRVTGFSASAVLRTVE